MNKNRLRWVGGYLLLGLAVHAGNAGWQVLAQPSPVPVPQTRSCADYTPVKLIALLAQLYTESGFSSQWVVTGTIASLSEGDTSSSAFFANLPSSPDRLQARARELLAQADAEERRTNFLAEVQWIIKECGKKE
jgi:hypothetical protein